jgi:hypothetical protein
MQSTISLRVWCYSCQTEVFLENNDPPLLNSPIIEAFEEEDFEKVGFRGFGAEDKDVNF